MNSRDQEKLLKEILPREDVADFREASLERGLVCLRRQRQRRYMTRAILVAVAVCGLWLGLVLKPRSTEHVSNTPPPPRTATAPANSSHVTFISDEELLAMFPKQPVALIGKPGQQRLVFLNKTDKDRAPF